MVATAAAPYGLLFLATCGFGSYIADRVADDGVTALGQGLVLLMTAALTLLLAGVAAGATSAARQLAATRRLCERVDRSCLVPPARIPAGVEVVDHDEPFAFTFGLSRPRIALSRGLVEQLLPDELQAVVAHERYHVRARDPLKLVVVRVLARTSFFLPAIGHLVTRYLVGRELAADRRSVRDLGRPALAGALFKVVAGPPWDELDTAAAMAGPELLEVRVDQLEDGAEPPLPRLPLAPVVLSALVVGTLAAIVTAAALQGGLSMMTSDQHGMLSTPALVRSAVGGLVCTAGWSWLVTAAFRRLARPSLTMTHTRCSTT